jgi:glycerate 2-kinase
LKLKYLTAIDKWRGSLTAGEACESMAKGILLHDKETEVVQCPLADGGEGSLMIVAQNKKGQFEKVITEDPLGRRIQTHYYLEKNGVAYIESALIIGHHLLSADEKNPMVTHSRGLGLVLKSVKERGVKEVHIFLGGSVTSDGGMGMLDALGVRFYDFEGQLLAPKGENLRKVHEIDIKQCLDFGEILFNVWCDVLSPLTGPKGAALLFSPQKGADESMAKVLEEGMLHYQYRISQNYVLSDISDRPGSGAAGGLGFAADVFLGGIIGRGLDFFMEMTECEKKIREADIIITGEGKFDKQSLLGKVTGGVAALAKKYQKPCFVVCGINDSIDSDFSESGIDGVFSLKDEEPDEKRSLQYAGKLLERIGFKIVNQSKKS